MHFAVLPPEVNSGRMYAGSGAGSMLAAATAWDELANELQTTAANLESVISGLSSEPWQGPSSASMVAAAAPQLAWLNTTAAQATQTSAQANAAAVAYESAFAMTVPPPVIEANRAELTSLIATNLLGQNAAAIAATEVAYSEMWAQDVAAMYGYAAESRAATEVTPFASPEQTTDQGGIAAQSAAAAQAAGSAAGQAQSAMSSGSMTAVPNALQALTSLPAGATDFSQFSNPYDLISLGSGLLGNGLGLIGLSGAAGFVSEAEHEMFGSETVSAPQPSAAASQRGAMPARRLPEEATTVSAETGRASSLGRLSVPQGWASAAQEVRLVAQASPMASPVPTTGPSPGLFSGMPVFGGAPLMQLSGRGAGDSRDRRQANKADAPGILVPAGETSRDRGTAAGDRPGRSAAELREMTDLLGKLGRLRDSGVLTDTEFDEQKQRLLNNR
ncbi:PPE family protein, SVP subgroup [Mycobacterium montefiorense]|uniref:PPE family protein, SVP subgroup n=1 Tax=Mycobacterium montefiorense TaxID=154654 RepID=UPI0021DC78E2|nr:PPE domain-containing protein [Mycobacterium montefiorense]MCV7428541.1 PPE domain-containing protein [Mycobacterium montefiorense]GLE51073.1 PPE family protein [Mycobacterium montefiorense]